LRGTLFQGVKGDGWAKMLHKQVCSQIELTLWLFQPPYKKVSERDKHGMMQYSHQYG